MTPAPAPTLRPTTDDYIASASRQYSGSQTADIAMVFFMIVVSMFLLWMCTNMLCVGDRATLERNDKVRYLNKENQMEDGSHGMTDMRPPKKRASFGLTKKEGQSGMLRLGYLPAHGRIESPRELGGDVYQPKRHLELDDVELGGLGDLPGITDKPPDQNPQLSTPRASEGSGFTPYDPRHDMRAEQVHGSSSGLYTPSNARGHSSYIDDDMRNEGGAEDDRRKSVKFGGGGEEKEKTPNNPEGNAAVTRRTGCLPGRSKSKRGQENEVELDINGQPV